MKPGVALTGDFSNHLRKLAKSKTYEAVFKRMAKRKVKLAVTDLYQFIGRKDNKIQRTDLFELFREFEQMGLGKLKQGDDYRLRFYWEFNLNQVARTALGEDVDIHHVPRVEAEPIPQKSRNKKLKMYEFPLRTNFFITFWLPVDLTNDEAERICSQIRLLPTSNFEKKEIE